MSKKTNWLENAMILVARVFGTVILSVSLVVAVLSAFFVGYVRGFAAGSVNTQKAYEAYLNDKVSSTAEADSQPLPSAAPAAAVKPAPASSQFGGPQLWEAVNKRRVELGVNPLSNKAELCTIASIRLNQLLDLGKLDGHEGFSKLPTERTDLKWIFDKYNVSEFLVSGATSAQNAVDLWENTLGHKQLLSGGEYVWGCIYAQEGFGVAITAY